MMLALAAILLVLLFLLPFLPGARESRRKQDAEPLHIDMEYRKDPRYFSLSFRKKFVASLDGLAQAEGFRELMLSKEEKTQIIGSGRFQEGQVVENMLYVMQDLVSGKQVTFNKEVYVRGTARIGEENQLQALACDSTLHLAKGARFYRWLDAEGDIIAAEQCMLGMDAACGGTLSLAHGCTFMRLYGFPIAVGADPLMQEHSADLLGHDMTVFEGSAIERDLTHIPPRSRKDCSIISADSLVIGEESVIRGHVKTHGTLIIGARVTIIGNVFAEGAIEIGPHSRVLGTVFSQDQVLLQQGVRVGARDRIKSVIGKKAVTLEDNVRVYGQVMTEGKGVVA